MSRVTVDASVVTKWFLPEPASDAARALRQTATEMSAPRLLSLEVANALWKRVQRGELERGAAEAILGALSASPLKWFDSGPHELAAFRLANETGRTVYDCVYVALPMQLGVPLVTADRKLYNALQTTAYASHVRWVEHP